jgi:hypothetical protein
MVCGKLSLHLTPPVVIDIHDLKGGGQERGYLGQRFMECKQIDRTLTVEGSTAIPSLEIAEVLAIRIQGVQLADHSVGIPQCGLLAEGIARKLTPNGPGVLRRAQECRRSPGQVPQAPGLE